MTTPKENLVKAIEVKIKELATKTYHTYNITPEVEVIYDLDSSRRIGECYSSDGKSFILKLNPSLLNELGEEYIEKVLVHEYAHAVVNTLYPHGFVKVIGGIRDIKPHGKEFKEVCRLFDIEGKATTTFTSNTDYFKEKKKNKRVMTKIDYTCDCGYIHKLSMIKHNRVLKGQDRTCKMCKSKLRQKID